MDFNIDVRRKQLNSLDQFIKSSRENFDSILKSLSWTESAVTKDDSMVTCTINPEHKVPSKALENHIEACTLRQQKYTNCPNLLSEPLLDKKASIFLSKQQKLDLFSNAVKSNKEFKTVWKCEEPDPKSADRIYCTYSPDERLVLYEHCVASTTGPNEVPEFNIFKVYNNATGAPLTADEERARERDLKRRSFKYKKTYTSRDRDPVQVTREVINGQMELYCEWLETKDQNNVDIPQPDQDDVKATNHRKGPRTPEHEAPPDDIEYNGSDRRNERDDFDRRDSRHSSRTRNVKRERSKSPRRRQSRDRQRSPQRRRQQSRSRSRSRSPPRGGGRHSFQHHNNHSGQRNNGDRSRDRSRDKRKSYSSRYSDGFNGRRRERSRSRSPRYGRSRR